MLSANWRVTICGEQPVRWATSSRIRNLYSDVPWHLWIRLLSEIRVGVSIPVASEIWPIRYVNERIQVPSQSNSVLSMSVMSSEILSTQHALGSGSLAAGRPHGVLASGEGHRTVNLFVSKGVMTIQP